MPHQKRFAKQAHTCFFRGKASTRQHELRAPCDAAFGQPNQVFARCASCDDGNSTWVCLACWAGVQERAERILTSKGDRAYLLSDPVYHALRELPFTLLAEGAMHDNLHGQARSRADRRVRCFIILTTRRSFLVHRVLMGLAPLLVLPITRGAHRALDYPVHASFV